MTIDSDRYWADVPSIDDPPAAGRRSFKEVLASRRTALKAVGVLGGALAINIVGALPPSRIRSANAAVGTEYTHCAGYSGFSGYADGTTQKTCVAGTYSRSYCGSDGWFASYQTTNAGSWPVAACGEGYTDRNAWRWDRSGTVYRCADGYINNGSGQMFRVCAWPNP